MTIWAICKNGLLPNGPKWADSEIIGVKMKNLKKSFISHLIINVKLAYIQIWNKECFPNVKQVFLLYLVGSFVTLSAY